MPIDLSDYVDVPTRIREFKEQYPEGSLRPMNPERPYDVVTIGDKTFIVVVAAAFRHPDDPAPGVGMAWEQFPGTSNFTKNSELQNAETSAWGRAIVAALAAETKKGVASQEEVRNRRAETQNGNADGPLSSANLAAFVAKCEEKGVRPNEVVGLATEGRTDDPAQLLRSEVAAAKEAMDRLAGAPL